MALLKALIAVIGFVVLLAWERIAPYRNNTASRKRLYCHFGFWGLNVLSFILIVMPITLDASNHAIWQRPDAWPIWLDILLLDLWLYGWHRMTHTIPALWRFHEVHHLDEQLDVTTALRFHTGEVILSAMFRSLLIIALAFPMSSVLLFEACILLASFFHHSNIALPSWCDKMLRYVIVTPSIHWVHHHTDPSSTNSNYATIFSIWDRLFHTSSKVIRHAGLPLGIEGMRDQSWKQLLLRPFTLHPESESDNSVAKSIDSPAEKRSHLK